MTEIMADGKLLPMRTHSDCKIMFPANWLNPVLRAPAYHHDHWPSQMGPRGTAVWYAKATIF